MRVKNSKYLAILIFCLFILTFSNAESLSGKIIVVDPGHAAKNSAGKIVNYGCKNASSVKEMNVVIDISEILGELFLQEGATVYFTHDRKNFWLTAESQYDDNKKRAEFANSKNADLFLRIHCNWSPNKKKRGVSVLWYKDDSKKIAETVYEEIKESGVIVDGIHKQHLVGFEFAKVPSILIEYGYLSNKSDEKLLKDKKYLQKISEDVINAFKKYYEIVEIIDILYYRDGGTTGIIIKDSYGKNFSFCFDGRLQEVNKTNKRHIYLGATYPTDPNAQKLLIGGAEEKSILKILRNWVAGKIPKEEQVKLSNINTVVGLSEEELKIYRVLKIIGILENR